ncbi:hypothetical protein M433DRAFT_151897 [Acidomyces richmondensis BFW]|nr:MAG: hypothetical protein FE78DRAFT_86439 [Acidomyces sp. 'richmondensis']KYG47743.1 hypothetical protein M433DRAFT_151897 [Acidomyces richmondensis BFW]
MIAFKSFRNNKNKKGLLWLCQTLRLNTSLYKINPYGLILKTIWPIPHSMAPPLPIKNHPKPSHVKPSAGGDVGDIGRETRGGTIELRGLVHHSDK